MTKKKVFDKVKAVKENARTRVGTVPATRLIPHKTNKAETKYPKTQLEKELED